MCFLGLLDLKNDINVFQFLLTVISSLQMSPSMSLLFILSLYLLHMRLHLNKYIFQLSLILLLCIVYLKILLLHHLFKFRVVNLPIVHMMTLL